MHSIKNQLRLVLLGLFSVGFVFIACFMKTKLLITFDRSMILFVQSFELPALTTIMMFFSRIGNFSSVLIIFIIISLLLYFLKCRNQLILFSSVVILTPMINQLIKQLFYRERPNFHRFIEISGYSFPSGHAMNAASLYSILIVILWHNIPSLMGKIILIIICSIFILMIGVSRIYLGVHYPSDVIAGYFASGIILIISIVVHQKLVTKQP